MTRAFLRIACLCCRVVFRWGHNVWTQKDELHCLFSDIMTNAIAEWVIVVHFCGFFVGMLHFGGGGVKWPLF